MSGGTPVERDWPKMIRTRYFSKPIFLGTSLQYESSQSHIRQKCVFLKREYMLPDLILLCRKTDHFPLQSWLWIKLLQLKLFLIGGCRDIVKVCPLILLYIFWIAASIFLMYSCRRLVRVTRPQQHPYYSQPIIKGSSWRRSALGRIYIMSVR